MAEDDNQIEFCTLGMLIIDEIHPSPNSPDQTVQKDILGGAGTYSALGARLLSSKAQEAKSVGWIIDIGSDFPEKIRSTIESWGTTAVFRKRSEGELTTRGWNGYSGNEVRAFKYLTEKKRLTARDLSPALLNSKSFHLICGGARCLTEVMQICDLRREENEKNKRSPDPNIPSPRPLIVWEPVPDLCVPLALPETCRVLCMIDVISPNHAELGAFFEYTHPETHVDRETVEAHAQQFIAWGIGRDKKGAIVVRCGAEGCYVQNSGVKRWLPAYHTSEDSSHANDDAANSSGKVVDPTGGGNGFLGGLAVGMVRSGGDVVEAALWGSIAASYCIEQVGMPELTAEADNAERWNGTAVRERLEEFRTRVDRGYELPDENIGVARRT